MSTPSRMMAMSTKLSADSPGRNCSFTKLFATTLPIMRWASLPTNSTLMKSPDAGMKVSSEPANRPGRLSGSVTLRNVRQPLA